MFTNKFALSAIFALAVAVVPQTASAAVFVSVNFAPPELPVYAQPAWPGDGYIWTPGYWGYGPEGYYWIPGTWVIAPEIGFLWTPGYWGWGGSSYMFHEGYWGQHVGFYGGVNYGYGYGGVGYEGGYWQGRTFNYNRTVNNISLANSRNVYNKPVSYGGNNRTSYNGGTGGVRLQASASEQAAGRESHTAPTGLQTQHEQAASRQRTQFASQNHGQPAVTATPKPQPFSDPPAARQNQRASESRQQERYSQPQPQAQQRSAPQPAMRQQEPYQRQAEQRPVPQPQQERRQPQAERPAPQPAARQDQPREQAPQPRSAPQQQERQQQQQQREASPQQQQRPQQQAAPQQHGGPGHEEHDRR